MAVFTDSHYKPEAAGARIWIVMKGDQPRALCTTEELARKNAALIVTDLMASNRPRSEAESVYLRVMFVDDCPIEDEDLAKVSS